MMKLILLVLTTCSCVIAFAQQIPNGGFENWTVNTLYENPEDWTTSNGLAPGVLNATKVTGPSGSYGIRIETQLLGNDTVFGFFLHGDFVNDMPTAGVPFNTQISNIEGSVRYDMMPNDTAYIVFVAWAGGIPIAEETIAFAGVQNSWTGFNHPLTWGAVTPDSVLFGAGSSNPFDNAFTSIGSWIEFDNIQLTSPSVTTPDLLPNHDFENWFDVNVEVPDDWSTLYDLSYLFPDPTVVKSMDAATGSFALELRSVQYENDSVPGIITNGNINQFGTTGGYPYSASAQSFDFKFKYLPNGVDTGYISINFYNSGTLVGAALYGFSPSVTSWTQVNRPITMIGTPDTMLITAVSGQNVGTVLMLDDLDLSGGTVGASHITSEQIMKAYPVPATDRLFIDVTSHMLGTSAMILDLRGRVVREVLILDPTTTFDLQGLNQGYYQLVDHSGMYRVGFIKN